MAEAMATRKPRSEASKVVDFAAARLRRQARKGEIVVAPQVEIAELEEGEVDEFLSRIFGIEGALVTDESRLSDFISFGNDLEESAQMLARIEAEYGLVVGVHDRLIDVLHRIEKPG